MKQLSAKPNRRRAGAGILLCAFLLPAALMSALYFLKGFYPFGDRSILIMDAADQYVEFFSGLHYWGKTGNALFSWSKGFGQNNIG